MHFDFQYTIEMRKCIFFKASKTNSTFLRSEHILDTSLTWVAEKKSLCAFCSRNVYNAAVWYYNHLAGLQPVVMITEDNDAISEFSALNSGVYVISTQVYSFILCPVKYVMLNCQYLSGVRYV